MPRDTSGWCLPKYKDAHGEGFITRRVSELDKGGIFTIGELPAMRKEEPDLRILITQWSSKQRSSPSA